MYKFEICGKLYAYEIRLPVNNLYSNQNAEAINLLIQLLTNLDQS